MKRNAIVRDDEEEITPPPPGMFEDEEPETPTAPAPKPESVKPPAKVAPQPKPVAKPTPVPSPTPTSPDVAAETPETTPEQTPDAAPVPTAPAIVKTPETPVIPPGPDNWPLGNPAPGDTAPSPAPPNVARTDLSDPTDGADPNAVAKIDSPSLPMPEVPAVRPTAEPSQAPDKRLAVPSETDRERGMKILAELYQEEWTDAKTVEKKQALARTIHKKAGEMSADPIGHYLMLDLVRKLSLQVGDVKTTLSAVNDLGENFQIDSVSERLTALEGLSRALRNNADADLFLKECRETLSAAVKQDDFDRADKSVELGLSVAKRADRQKDIQQWQAIKKVLDEAKLAFGPVTAARSTLETDPANAQAHTVVGKYLCFYQRDWERGLVHLANGGDIKLKVLAQIDQNHPSVASQQSDLGDQWYDIAEDAKPWAKQSIQLRAAHWYQASLGGLPAGLNRARVQKRIKEISELTGEKALVGNASLPDE
jgi:hypothetical protein